MIFVALCRGGAMEGVGLLVYFGLEVQHLLKAKRFSEGLDVSSCLKICQEPCLNSDEGKQRPVNNFKEKTNGITAFFF